jgi:hypothetical protein
VLQVLGNMGRLVRIIFALALAVFWAYLAYSWDQMGELGPGEPTVIGVALLAIVAGFSGLVGLVRIVASTASAGYPRSSQSGSITPEQRDLDADEIIARYMARQEAEGVAGVTPESGDTTPSPPQFGRKDS